MKMKKQVSDLKTSAYFRGDDECIPIHESSSFVNGPVLRGVLFERSTGKAGENHPNVGD